MVQDSESEKPDGNFSTTLKTLWEHQLTRTALLVPTALTALAGVQDVGKIAHYIVSKWHPITVYLGELLSPALTVIHLPKRTLLMLVFFAPFSLYGLADAVRHRKLPLNPVYGIFVIFLYYGIMLFALANVADAAQAPRVYVTITGLNVAGYLGVHFLLRKTRFAAFALPIGAYCGFLLLFLKSLLYTFETPPLVLLFDVVLVLPLFAADRIAQTALIMAGVVIISAIYEYASPLLAT